MTHVTQQGCRRRRQFRHLIRSFSGNFGLAFALIASPFILPFSSAQAQDGGQQFLAQTGEAVTEAITAADEGAFDIAVTHLNAAPTQPDLSAFERASIYQMLGQYHYELDQLAAAKQAFEKAIAAKGLLPKDVENLEFVIAKLMIANGEFREGAQRFETHLTSADQPKPEDIELLMMAWTQAQDYKRALPWAERWFADADPKTREHFDMMNYLYNTLSMTARQTDLIKQMISRWPGERALWESWASILANGGNEADAFEVTKMIYLGGALTEEPELLKVVQYYSFYDMPYQAAEILEREMKGERIARTPDRLLQLSDLYRQAREYKRALPILEIAATQSGQAKPYADWGEALYNEGQCDAAERAFSEAINRGYDAGKSWMLVANCHYDRAANLDRLDCTMSDTQIGNAPITRARQKAKDTFKKVPQTSPQYGNAGKWLTFIRAEEAAFQRRCDFGVEAEIAMCFGNIERAYDVVFLTGEFQLDDEETCQKYVAEYDAKYITKYDATFKVEGE